MSKGRFGIHGGQYIPETLMNAVIELEKAYGFYKDSMNGSSWWQSHHQQYIAGIANL